MPIYIPEVEIVMGVLYRSRGSPEKRGTLGSRERFFGYALRLSGPLGGHLLLTRPTCRTWQQEQEKEENDATKTEYRVPGNVYIAISKTMANVAFV